MLSRRIVIGTATFTFEADIAFKTHRRSALRFVDKVSRRLETDFSSGFSVDGQWVSSDAIFLDPASLEPGSLKAVAHIVAIVAGIGSLVANYSEIKEEIPHLIEDISSSPVFTSIERYVAEITAEAPVNWPPSRVLYPVQTAIVPRTTDDLLQELNLQRRKITKPQKQKLIRGD
ncbi:hypothetical protein [Arenibacterium sp. LLYu02]|uniref:hypothetical protein n=1 Tax=Arenibacterium sp. LLYu02 TaxID=3404132 RepID=UPI003B22601D